MLEQIKTIDLESKQVELQEKDPKNVACAYILLYWKEHTIDIEQYQDTKNSYALRFIDNIKCNMGNEEVVKICELYNAEDLKKEMKALGFEIKTISPGSLELEGFAEYRGAEQSDGKVKRTLIPRISKDKVTLLNGVVVV